LWQLSLLAFFSYFAGNFCGAIILSKNFIQKDIRELGSKNAGTTNMTRIFGIKYGAATFIIDFLKGFICSFIGKELFTIIGGTDVGIFASYLAGFAVILGHNYPLLLGFKGGKGFAAGIGVFLAVNSDFTIAILLIGLIWLLIVDRMSVYALTFFMIEAVYYTFVYTKEYWWLPIFAWLYLLLAVIAHWSNIIRLMHGEEKPLGLLNRLKNS
jgi:glycerol-3-phosphate acyltransferase PlsY